MKSSRLSRIATSKPTVGISIASAIASVILMGAINSADAQTTWIGGVDGNWETVQNWSTGALPASAGGVFFGASPNTTITLASTKVIYDTTFYQDSPGYIFNLTGGGAAGQSVNNSGTLTNSFGAGHVTYNYGLRITSGNGWQIFSDSLAGMTVFGLSSTIAGTRNWRLNGIGGGTVTDQINETAAGISLHFRGGGEWKLTGTANVTGAQSIRGGATAFLDYTSNNSKKLGDSGALTLTGGKVRILGNQAGTAVNLNGVTLSASNNINYDFGFASRINANASSAPEAAGVTVNLGTITSSTSSIFHITGDAAYTAAFTTTGNIIYKNDYAAVTSGTIGAYTGYTTLPASGVGSSTTLYSKSGGGTMTPGGDFQALGIKVTSTGENQVLDLGSSNLTLAAAGGSLLYTGANDYTIAAAAFGRNANAGVTHWINTGTATLTLQGAIGSGTAQFRTSGEGAIRLTTGRTGAANRVYVGEGTLIFAGNDITGTTANTVGVQAGATLGLENNTTINANTTVNLHGLGAKGNGALRNLGGNNTVAGNMVLGFTSKIVSDAGSLTLQGPITASDSSALMVGGAGSVIINGNIDSTLTYGIDKSGSGTLTLNGTNSYTGQTVVSGGLLAVNGGGLNGSHVIVKAGGALGGSGPIAGTVTVQNGGTLSPGNSPGNQIVENLELNGGGNYLWQVYDASGVAGTGYDTYTLDNLDLTGLLSPFKFTIQLESLSDLGPDTPGFAIGFDALLNSEWTLASFDTVNTTGLDLLNFNNYFSVDTVSFDNPFVGEFRVALANNSLLLQYTAVPEPGTTLLLLPAAAFAVQVLRRRRKES